MPNHSTTSPLPFGSQAYRDYFRSDYVEKEAGGRFLGIQNGNLYMSIVFALLIAVPTIIGYLINEFHGYFLLLLPVYFLICNLLEYLLHRYPMHHKMKHLGFLYEHVTVHHNFYNENFYYYEHPRDYMAVFLPLLYFSFITVVLMSGAALVFIISDFNNALFFLLTGYAYYLMYEILHFSYHASENSLIKKLPFVKQLSNFHLQHHKAPLMAHYNFNITFPIFDTIFGTVYQEGEKIRPEGISTK